MFTYFTTKYEREMEENTPLLSVYNILMQAVHVTVIQSRNL